MVACCRPVSLARVLKISAPRLLSGVVPFRKESELFIFTRGTLAFIALVG